MVVDGLEQPLAAEAQDPALDSAYRREILGQHALGTAGPQHTEDDVHDLAHRPFSWAARPGRRRHEWVDDLPLRIVQIASIT